ncbi:MAG: DUF350 domain-containing protein [Bacteroidetes bacterium]|jgi:uncharacterized membrane protein YjfL (UPF0719 family)|nr:DUF350 domain-containing protein [Bacteroidota bacterium]
MLTNAISLSYFTPEYILSTLAYFVSAFILLLIGKFAHNIFHPAYKTDSELVEKDNMAFAISQVGYYIGIVLVIMAALSGESLGLLLDLQLIGMYGLVGIVLLNISVYINDALILRKFKVSKEILEDKNAGTGVVVAATSIATGLVLLGAFNVEGASLLDSVGCWAIAQVVLIIGALIYNVFLPYSVHEHIEKDNVAVGIGFAGALVALGIIIQFAIHDLLNGWLDFSIALLVDTVIGFIFLPVARVLTDKILLPKRNLTDELINQEKPNKGVALIEAFAYVGGAMLITWVL